MILQKLKALKLSTRNLTCALCLLCLFLFLGCSPSIPQIPAEGEIMGQTIDTTVDSEIARYYLENYLQNNRTNPELDRRIDQVYQKFDQPLPSRETLKTISESFSVDFAALFLATRLWEIEANKEAQALFMRKVVERKTAIQKDEPQSVSKKFAYIILFVPGWDYKENGHITGADLAVPRKLMTELGMENHLIEIPSNGSVEENANFLTKEIVHYSRFKKPILLVGPSSAGPAIHLTLSEKLSR